MLALVGAAPASRRVLSADSVSGHAHRSSLRSSLAARGPKPFRRHPPPRYPFGLQGEAVVGPVLRPLRVLRLIGATDSGEVGV